MYPKRNFSYQSTPRRKALFYRLRGKCAVLLFVVVHLLPSVLWAQDPHFSQYYAAPLYLNPALMGAERDISFSINHRTQWRSLGFPQYTSQFSAIGALSSTHARRMPRYCLGFSAFSDVAGAQGSFVATGASLAMAYNLPLDQHQSHMITLGAQAGITQKRLDAGQLQWGSQFDPSVGFNPDRQPGAAQDMYQANYPLTHAGVVWYFNPRKSRLLADFSAYAGVSAMHLNRPDESFFSDSPSRLPLLLKLHGGADWTLSPHFSLSPAYLLMHQNGYWQINLGTYLSYHMGGRLPRRSAHPARPQGDAEPGKGIRLNIGIWHRFGDSVIGSLGMSQQRFAFGFSYDFNVSTLRQYTRGQGAYELSVSYKLRRSSAFQRFSIPML
jgi:type IX secretion system PorP/SprF family membrane protein